MLVKNAENYINRLKKIIIARFGNIETAITHDNDCDMHAVQISFLLNGKYSWVCAYDDDDVITYYVSGKGHTKEMTIEDTQVKSMYKVLDKVEDLAYETDIEATEATEDYNEDEEILDSKESTEHDRIKYLMDTHSLVPHVSINSHCMETVLYKEELLTQRYGNTIAHKCKMYNNGYYGCPADRQGNRCCGEKWCAETWKRYEAIINPEWHHVSLATLANIDFDMLDKKRQVYLKAHRELKRTLVDLSKCKTGHAYEVRARKFMCDMISQYYDNEISYSMRKYLDLQLSMSNVVNGVWSSYVEPAMGLHESRRYSRPTLTY